MAQEQSRTEQSKPERKAAEFIFVKNTTKGLIGVAKTGGGKSGAVVQDILMNLKPGLNKLSVADWETAKKQKMTGVRLNEGHLVEVAEIDSLRNIDPDEARKLISGIVDKSQLLEWKDVDHRKEVQKAIDARLIELDKPEPGAVPPSFRGSRA